MSPSTSRKTRETVIETGGSVSWFVGSTIWSDGRWGRSNGVPATRSEQYQRFGNSISERTERIASAGPDALGELGTDETQAFAGSDVSASATAEDSLDAQTVHDRPEYAAMWWHRSRPGAFIALVDVVLVLLVVLVELSLGAETRLFGFAFTAAIMLWLFLAHMHQSRFTLSFLDDLPRLALITVGVMAGTTWLFVGLGLPTPDSPWRSLAIVGLVLLLGRAVSYAIVNQVRAASHLQSRVVIVGAGEVGRQLGEAIATNPKLGLELTGYVDDDSRIPEAALPAPVLGSLQNLPGILRVAEPQHVFIAFPNVKSQDVVDRVRSVDRMAVEISVVPRFFEMLSNSRSRDEIDRIPLERLNRAVYRSVRWPLKRAMDMVIAGSLLLLLSPLIAVLALALRIQSGPGVIFRQRRVGVDGVQFDMLKLRSLRPVDDDESATKWNIRHDNRLTPLGKFIRKTSLDELPQLWNIVRGDMSLVGPRPERQHFVDNFAVAYRGYDQRHRVPSGLTGWAQIHGLRGDTSIEERARYDNYYIENWSLWLDMRILLKTATSLMNGSG